MLKQEHYKDMDVNFAIHGDGVLYTPKEDELIKIFHLKVISFHMKSLILTSI